MYGVSLVCCSVGVSIFRNSAAPQLGGRLSITPERGGRAGPVTFHTERPAGRTHSKRIRPLRASNSTARFRPFDGATPDRP